MLAASVNARPRAKARSLPIGHSYLLSGVIGCLKKKPHAGRRVPAGGKIFPPLRQTQRAGRRRPAAACPCTSRLHYFGGAALHTLTVPSEPEATSRVPSGLNATPVASAPRS